MSEFVGVPRLGFQNSSVYGDLVLGDEYEVVDGQPDDTDAYIVSQSERRVRVRYVKNTSGLDLVPGASVKRDITGDVAHDVAPVVSAGEIGCGVVDPRIGGVVSPDSKFLIIIKGPIDQIAGGALTKGSSANIGDLGEVINGSNVAADAYGVVMDDAAAQGDVVRVDVDFRSVGI